MSDAKYAAASLREYATYTGLVLDSDGNPVMDDNGMPEEVTAYHFLNMTTATAPGCGEWTVWETPTRCSSRLSSCRPSNPGWCGSAISPTPSMAASPDRDQGGHYQLRHQRRLARGHGQHETAGLRPVPGRL